MLVLPYGLQHELKNADHVSLMLQKSDHRDHFFLWGAWSATREHEPAGGAT